MEETGRVIFLCNTANYIHANFANRRCKSTDELDINGREMVRSDIVSRSLLSLEDLKWDESHNILDRKLFPLFHIAFFNIVKTNSELLVCMKIQAKPNIKQNKTHAHQTLVLRLSRSLGFIFCLLYFICHWACYKKRYLYALTDIHVNTNMLIKAWLMLWKELRKCALSPPSFMSRVV